MRDGEVPATRVSANGLASSIRGWERAGVASAQLVRRSWLPAPPTPCPARRPPRSGPGPSGTPLSSLDAPRSSSSCRAHFLVSPRQTVPHRAPQAGGPRLCLALQRLRQPGSGPWGSRRAGRWPGPAVASGHSQARAAFTWMSSDGQP